MLRVCGTPLSELAVPRAPLMPGLLATILTRMLILAKHKPRWAISRPASVPEHSPDIAQTGNENLEYGEIDPHGWAAAFILPDD